MTTLTVAQLKALLSIYDDNDTIEMVYKEPVKEIAYKEFSGGNEIRLSLDYLEGDAVKPIVRMFLSE